MKKKSFRLTISYILCGLNLSHHYNMRLINTEVINIASKHGINYPTPSNLNYFWGFGSISGFLLIWQILSGVLLAMHYSPEITLAFNSIEHIMRNVSNGWLIRYCHCSGASMFFIIVYIHIGRALYFKSYRKVTLWFSGIVIFLLMMATAFLGYVLPWGQMSLWGATVITNLFGAFPIVGKYIVSWLWGGFSVDNPTLKRFFVLHFLLPLVLAALSLLHITLLHINGSTNPLGICGKMDVINFYPKYIIKDLFGFFSIIGFLSILTVFYFPNALGHPDNYIRADALITPKHIVPEWYFLRAPSNLHIACWISRSTWFTLITIKTTDLSESSNRSLVRKNRGVQHVGKGIPGFIQRSLWCISSYCKYVYISFEKQEIVSSIKGWSTPWFTALQDTGRRSCNRAAVMLSTNSGRNQYAKFTKVFSMKFLGGSVSKNLGLPKGSNSYGNRVFVVIRNFSSEGTQLQSSDKEIIATKSGLDFLKDIADGKLNPSKNVYQIICDCQVLKVGYAKLKSKPASMTPGIDEKDLNDLRISEQYFLDLANKLKMERYRPKPTKRVFISKISGKKRFLGIPVIEDRIVQQALLYLLEAVFEKTFSGKSHGYRPNRGAHTACKNIRQWKGVSWFIEGDIVSYFDNINHHKLMEIINQHIKDQQVTDLLWKFLRAGTVIDNKYQKTTIGIPQGAIISPILSNIYLHSFDMYLDKLKEELDTKKTSEPNPEYINAKSKLRSKKGADKKKGYKELRKIKSTIRTGFKLYYIRYADGWLIGIWGSKKDATKIHKKIVIFLKEKLDLELSIEKTKIIHAGKEKAQFLGYEIYSPTPKESFFEKGKVKKRASHVSIYIDAPYNKLKEQLMDEKILVKKNGKWLINAVTHWINYNHAEILYRYNWIINGYLNYYSHVNNLNVFHKFIGFVLRHSCAITLGRKLKLRSRKKVFKKFGKNLEESTTKLKLSIPDNFKSNIKNYKITTNTNPFKILKWTVRTQNLIEGPCVGCGVTSNIEVHHVEKLSKIIKAKNPVHIIMSKLGRKQVPLCTKCHKGIHSGVFDKNKSPRKAR